MRYYELLADLALFGGFLVGFFYGAVTAWVALTWPNPLPLLLTLLIIPTVFTIMALRAYIKLRE